MSARREVFVVECRPARVKPHVWTPVGASVRRGDAEAEREESEWAEREGQDSGPKETIYRIVRYAPVKP